MLMMHGVRIGKLLAEILKAWALTPFVIAGKGGSLKT
jgi:hypothetical protein